MAVKAQASITLARIDNGAKGDTGKGIKSVVEQYYVSTSKTSQSGGSWSSTAPSSFTSGRYLWKRLYITYDDNTTAYSTAYYDDTVTKGAEAGVQVTSLNTTVQKVVSDMSGVYTRVTTEYYLSNSPIARTGGSWGTAYPTQVYGKYTFSRTKYTKKGGAVEYSGARLITPFTADFSTGRTLTEDPNFMNGMGGVIRYDNNNSGAVTVTRVARSADNPTKSNYEIRWVNDGSATPTPYCGGWVQGYRAHLGAVYAVKFIAKVPKGYTLTLHNGALGNGYYLGFVTPNAGTGKFETYIYIVRCGSTGSIHTGSAFGFVAVSGTAATPSSPIEVRVAYSCAYDLTDTPDYHNLSTRITQTDTTISSVATNVSNLTGRVQTAESKITPTAIVNTVSDQLKGSGKIETTKMILDKNGLTIDGGALTIKGGGSYADYVRDGVDVGGRNLVLDTTEKKTITSHESRNAMLVFPLSPKCLEMIKNDRSGEFTLTFEGRRSGGSSTSVINGYFRDTDGWAIITFGDVTIGNGFFRYSKTINATFATAKTYNEVRFRVMGGDIADFEVYNVKLEKGNVATDWTPAPEDVQDSIDAKPNVFTSTPTPPYKVGDLWAQGVNGELMRCKTARASGSYSATDWERADGANYQAIQSIDTDLQNIHGDIGGIQDSLEQTEEWRTYADPKIAQVDVNTAQIASTTETADNAMGIIDSWAFSLDEDVTHINGGKIKTGTIDAQAINAENLSAIRATLGDVTTGSISSPSGQFKMNFNTDEDAGIAIENAKKNTKLLVDADGTRVVNTSNAVISEWTEDGTVTNKLTAKSDAILAGALNVRKVGSEIHIFYGA